MANNRKMGYIFPKRIKDAIAGESMPFGSNFYVSDKYNKNSDTEREDRQKAISDARQPWYCPVCNKLMRKRLDSKYYNRRSMCMDCTILAEDYLRTHGLFEKYEREVSLRNYKAWLTNIKSEALDFISNLKETTEIVNHDGTFDTMHNTNNDTVKEFILKEIKDIDSKLKEIEDVDLSISAEDSIGINLIEIAKSLLKIEDSDEHPTTN